MYPILITLVFFGILGMFIASTTFASRKSVRVIAAIAAFGWSCLMFIAASWAERLNYNIWYSSAASKMIKACIDNLEHGNQDVVLSALRSMTNDLEVTYEHRGNFKQLAERAAENLSRTNAQSDPRGLTQ